MSIFEQDDKTCRAIADACAGSTNRPSNQPVELRFSRTTGNQRVRFEGFTIRYGLAKS
ncbi:hypothetical protein FGRA07_04406 [Fusarium graminearum]|nr:hypothetical protein FGRA07_04406 [Fusarium graminearum]